jgi:hypothetical protein
MRGVSILLQLSPLLFEKKRPSPVFRHIKTYCAVAELSIDAVSEPLLPNPITVEVSITKFTVPAADAKLVEKEDAATVSKSVKKKFLTIVRRPKPLAFTREIRDSPEKCMGGAYPLGVGDLNSYSLKFA